jgi:type I restriction enzyme S subunit
MKSTLFIPHGWQRIKVMDISLRIHYGYTASSIKKNTGIKLLRITDIKDYKVNWEEVPYCEITPDDVERFLLIENDIVFARTGATVGKSYLIQGCTPKAVFASYLIRIQLSKYINPKYLFYFFQSADYWEQIGLKSLGVGQPSVNANSLSNITLLLCPLSEQHRIVEKIEELFSELDNTEEILKNELIRIKIYEASILNKLFKSTK